MSSLPAEIYTRITSYLQPMSDTPTLLSLSLTSRPFHTACTPLLYNSLYLVGARPIPLLLRTFLAQPTLAQIPRLMYIHPAPSSSSPRDAYWAQLETLLRTAGHALEALCIIGEHALALPPAASCVLRGLHEASGALSLLRVSFCWDAEVAGFLESPGARGLTRLDTDGQVGGGQGPAPLELSRAAVPGLTVLDAPPAALFLLVPGRPVSLVRLRSGPLPRAKHLLTDCLAQSTAPNRVTAVDLGDLTYANRAETYSLEVLELAGRWLPQLEMLGRVNFPWTKDVPAARMHKALIRLPCLHALELVVSHIQPPVDVWWELATASELRMFGAGLRQIVFWKGYERRRWVWEEAEADWVVAADQEVQ